MYNMIINMIESGTPYRQCEKLYKLLYKDISELCVNLFVVLNVLQVHAKIGYQNYLFVTVYNSTTIIHF